MLEEVNMDSNGKLFKCLHFVLPSTVRPLGQSCQYQGEKSFGIVGIVKPPSHIILFR